MALLNKLNWYRYRLAAMECSEPFLHLRKMAMLRLGSRFFYSRWSRASHETDFFQPRFDPIPLPNRTYASPEFVEGYLKRSSEILRGRWNFFGGVPALVSSPPEWNRDYLAGVCVDNSGRGLSLNHRSLPFGADIKCIWELGRWSPLITLAQTAYLTNQSHHFEICLSWLEDWVLKNPPFIGYHWTSALETATRLLAFVWLDQIFSSLTKGDREADKELTARWCVLRSQLLPPLVWFTWHSRSFGSSANNHLLGELAGLLCAIARWPKLALFASGLGELKAIWENEVLKQFAEDGGNREQALNYQLYSFELCLHALSSIQRSGERKDVSGEVLRRLRSAAAFFVQVWFSGGWDYGDSDSAFVTPCTAEETQIPLKWWQCLSGLEKSDGPAFWWNNVLSRLLDPSEVAQGRGPRPTGGWNFFSESGIATMHSQDWKLRWDCSPLGYLKTAAHGHLDALHLSVVYQDEPWIIDPGTGAYYGDLRLRNYLASWNAHNGPAITGLDHPLRMGPFLWTKHHNSPNWQCSPSGESTANLGLAGYSIRRRVRLVNGVLKVVDKIEGYAKARGALFHVHWQFPPGSVLSSSSGNSWVVRIRGRSVAMRVRISPNWVSARMRIDAPKVPMHPVEDSLEGLCSLRFRRVEWGPRLELLGSTSVDSELFSEFDFIPDPN